MSLDEKEEYIYVLEEQIEDKNRLIQSLTEIMKQKDQELLLAKSLLEQHRVRPLTPKEYQKQYYQKNKIRIRKRQNSRYVKSERN